MTGFGFTVQGPVVQNADGTGTARIDFSAIGSWRNGHVHIKAIERHRRWYLTERHLSHAVEGHSYGAWPRLSGARPLDVWPHQQAAVVQAPLDGDRELAGGHRLAVAQPPGRPCERLPAAVRLGLEQQHLHRSAAAAPRPDPHRQHAGVVQHHQVVLAQLVQQVAEVPVPDRARGPVVHQEPRAVAGLGGRLRDQRRWKVVVEVVGAHRIS